MKIGLVEVLLLNNSRKVGLGFWIFFPMLALYFFSVVYSALRPAIVGSAPIGITFDQWMAALGLVTALVGGGTWMDKHYASKGVPDANAKVPEKQP